MVEVRENTIVLYNYFKIEFKNKTLHSINGFQKIIKDKSVAKTTLFFY